MIATIARGFAGFRAGESRSVPAASRPLTHLLDRCGAWLRRRDEAARLREMEPRLARDIGAAPTSGGLCLDGFAADPRPLWGIGLTPQPGSTTPPWSRRPGG